MSILLYLLEKCKHFTWEQWLFLFGILAVMVAAICIDKLINRDDGRM